MVSNASSRLSPHPNPLPEGEGSPDYNLDATLPVLNLSFIAPLIRNRLTFQN